VVKIQIDVVQTTEVRQKPADTFREVLSKDTNKIYSENVMARSPLGDLRIDMRLI
jgi:hypothetical protein